MRMIFKIEKFTFKGSEGSAIFGKPVEVSTLDDVSVLVRQYESLQSNSNIPSSSIRSQANEIEAGQILSQQSTFSQNDFATQVHEKASPLSKSSIDKNRTKRIDLLNLLTGFGAPKNPVKLGFAQTKQASDHGASGTSPPRAIEQNSTQAQRMIKHIQTEQESSISKDDNIVDNATARLTSTGVTLTASQSSALPQVLTDHTILRTPKPDDQNDIQKSEYTPMLPELQNAASRDLALEPDRSLLIVSSQELGKANNQEAQKLRKDLTSCPNRDTEISPDNEKEKFSLPFIDLFQDSNPFQGLKRIPRKFVRIHESQQKLIDRQDSWFQERNLNRSSYANIPSTVHDDLTSFIRQTASLRSESRSNNGTTKKHSRDAFSEKAEEAQDEVSEAESDDSNSDSVDSYEQAQEPELPVLSQELLEREEEEEEELISWSASPPDSRQTSNVVKQSTSRHISPLSIAISSSSQKLERITSQNQKQSVRHHIQVPVAIPFPSDPVDEDDMEYTVPYAEGEVLEEIIAVNNTTSQLSQELPSTAPGNPKLVQVEQTPHFGLSTLNLGDNIGEFYDEKKRNEVISDFIPATFDDTRSEEDTPSESSDNQADHHEFIQASTQSHHMPDFEMADTDEEEEDFLAQSQLISEFRNASQGKISVRPDTRARIDQSERLMNYSEGIEKDATLQVVDKPWLNASDHGESLEQLGPGVIETPHSSPEKHVTFDQQILKRSFEEIVQTPDKIIMKRQRRLKVAAMAGDEDCPIVDTKAMARASRHSFRSELVADEDNDPLVPMSSRRDHLAHQSGIPNTSPYEPVASSTELEAEQATAEFISIPNTQSSPTTTHKLGCTPLGHRDQSSQNSEIYENSSLKDFEPDQELDEHLTNEIQLSTSDNQSSQCIGYDAFKSIYTEYSGTRRQFTWTLVYLEFLERSNQIKEKTYDDFIRIIASEYTPWCANTPLDDLIPGVKFYEQNICNPPIFQFQLVTPQNLQDHLSSLDPREIRKFRAKFNPDKPEDITKIRNTTPGLTSKFPSLKNNKPSLKTPFFETFSQIHKPPTEGITHLSPKNFISDIPSTPHGRKLPWATSSPQVTNSRPSTRPKISLNVKDHERIDTQNKLIIIPKTPQQDLEASPILGTLNPSTIQSGSSRLAIQNGSPLHRKAASMRAPSATPSNVSHETLNQLGDNADSLDKVQGWIDDQVVPTASKKPKSPKHSNRSTSGSIVKQSGFQVYLEEKRRRSGGLILKSSTSDSKHGTRFCTKPKEKLHVEPQTQHWSF